MKVLRSCFTILSLSSLLFVAPAAWSQTLRTDYVADGKYRGGEVLGDMGWWQFDASAPQTDSSGKRNHLELRGTDTRFAEGALVIEEKAELGDYRAGAQAVSTPSLSPTQSFAAEIWFSLDAGFEERPFLFLFDKKNYHYAIDRADANHDYLALIKKVGNQHVFAAGLGFGEQSAFFESTPLSLEAARKYHLVLSLEAGKEAALFLDGQKIGSISTTDYGNIAPGAQPLVLGDRIGSLGHRLLGKIYQARFSNHALVFGTGKLAVDTSEGRTAFGRFEADAHLQLELTNDSLDAMPALTAEIEIEPGKPQVLAVPPLAPGEKARIMVPVDTSLRAGRYRAVLQARDVHGNDLARGTAVSVTIVPARLPHQMPIIMWDQATEFGMDGLDEMQKIGFTHEISFPYDDEWVWKHKDAQGPMPIEGEKRLRRYYDELFARQLGGIGVVGPGRYAGHYLPEDERNLYRRKDAQGNNYTYSNIDGNHPVIQEFAANVGKTIAGAYAGYPGLDAALINTEIRDGTQISHSDVSRQAYRQFSGEEIPAGLTSAQGVSYKNLTDFPANRVVRDNDKVLQFYRWFWSGGDGWPTLNSKANDGLKTAGANRFWSYTDPAVRVPSLWGSGGNVDYLSQWTYTYPDPLKIALAGDQLFAMAAGREGQQVMNMTQAIWYRKQTTSDPQDGNKHDWEVPQTEFITIAPDHLSEALWLKLTRNVRGIMYHGWGSLAKSTPAYTLREPATRDRLTDLIHNVVQPLAPTLLQIPDRKTDVAFLESFTSQIFAGRGTYGWGNGWGADSYLIANYAGLVPDVVYEQTLLRDGLDSYKLLLLTHCDVLPAAVVEKIKQFQARGGLIIGDQYLTPALQPDILLRSFSRGEPEQAKRIMLEKAGQLKAMLSGFYQPSLSSSNADVLVRKRSYKNADYVFVINDHRTYGDYVGQYKKVMEKGLPAQTTVTAHTKTGRYVYDLMARKPVQARGGGGKLEVPVALAAGEGKLLLMLDQQVGALQVTPAVVQNQLTAHIRLDDKAGRPIQAVVPLTVKLIDPQQREAEGSGHYGAVDGQTTVNLKLASNDARGLWTVRVTEQLTGQAVEKTIEVR